MMDKIFPNFMKTINTQIRKAQQTPSARNRGKTAQRDLIIK